MSRSDDAELVCAPPELRTTTGGADSLAAIADSDADAPVAELDSLADVESVDDDAADDASLDDEDSLVDEEDSLDEPEFDGVAIATDGELATAVPMPSATANAPTRPMYCAESMIDLPQPVSPPRRPGVRDELVVLRPKRTAAAVEWLW